MQTKDPQEITLFLVCGKARQGKSTVASYIRDYYEEQGLKTTNLEISAPLKNLAMHNFGWDGRDETKPRDLLSQLGTQIIREKLQKHDYMINRAIEDCEILANFFSIITIADVRFEHEIYDVKQIFSKVIVIEVVRPGFDTQLTEQQQKHETETGLDQFTDYDLVITNDGDLETLRKTTRQKL